MTRRGRSACNRPQLCHRAGSVNQAPDPLDELIEREREVLQLMAEGRTNKAIGQQLFITEHTVEKHVKNTLGKFSIPARAEDHRRVLAVLTYLNSA